MKLIETLTDVFITRGYEVMISSPENSYLLLKKDGSILAVGYSDPGHHATEGEVEMFISMSEDASADSMLFISPEKLRKDARKTLDRGGVATWDRMALAIAIGEQVLMKPEKVEKEEEQEFNPSSMMALFQQDDVDPLTELRDFETKMTDDFKVQDARVPRNDTGVKVRKTESFKVEKMDFPDLEDEKHTKVISTVSEDVLMNAWAGFDDWKEKEKVKKVEVKEEKKDTKKEVEPTFPSFDLPLMEVLEETSPEKRPWVGSILAPRRTSTEEACAKASVPPDTELMIEHVPQLLVSISYALKNESGEKVERTGEYLYDPIKWGIVDIPSALADELKSTLSVWDGIGAVKDMDKARENDKGYVRALKERLTRETHAEDRLVRETLMSTIYQEVRYLFDPASFNIRWSRRVVVPYYVKKDENGKMDWMVDSYLGRYLSFRPS